jgi:hypothetical protein
MHDYVAPLVSWDPVILRMMLRRVEEVAGRGWATAVGQQLHFSEFILYGVFVDELAPGAAAFSGGSSLCREHWKEEPLSLQEAVQFVDGVSADDVAVMISAKSNTPLAIRRVALGQDRHRGDRD